MDEKNMEIAVSVDYALIAAINSLTVALSKVPGFDVKVASRMIDQFIRKPINPDIPNLEVYEQVLENVRFHLKHPIEDESELKLKPIRPGIVVPLFGKSPDQSDQDHPQG